MNGSRECYLTVCNLPYDVKVRFGKSGPPDEKFLRPVFRKLGSEKCLARVPVSSVNGKEVIVRLPESLACHGEGRFELVLHDECCQVCDTVEIWFEADCEIVEVSGTEPSEVCHGC